MVFLKNIKTKFFFFVAFGLLLFSYCVSAQNPSQIDVLTTDEGLPFRSVNSIDQDKSGAMWFGTEIGLMRYDGYHFKIYNSDKNNPFYIEEEQVVLKIVINQSTNVLWYMANLKLFNLDLYTDKVTNFNGTHNIKGNVMNLLKTTDGTIWVLTDDSSNKKDNAKHYLQKFTNGKFEVMATIPGTQDAFSGLIENKKGHIIVSVAYGTLKFSANGDLLNTHQLSTFSSHNKKSNFTISYFDRNNRHYFFPQKKVGIFTLNETDLSSKHILKNEFQFYNAIQDHEDNIWFASYGELLRMDTDGNFKEYTAQLKSQFDYTRIQAFFIDGNQLLWIATDNGLFKIRIGEGFFTTLFKSKNIGWGTTMRGIFEDDKGTIFAKSESLNKLLYKTVNGKVGALNIDLEKSALEDSQFVSIFFALDSDKKSVFTLGQTLLKINLESGQTKSYGPYKSNITFHGQNPILKLKNGKLLFGQSLSTLVIFDPKTETSSTIFNNKYIETDYSDFRYFKESTTDSVVWIGTKNNGLLKINLNGHLEQVYSTDTKISISRNYVFVIDEDLKGNVWVGTFGGGLNYISADGKTIKTYTTSQGLPNNNVVGFLFDDEQNMWISTYNGLSYFNPTTEVFQNFYAEDGLTNSEFNYTSFFKDSKGNFYFGGMNGLNMFKPKEVFKQSESSKMRFTEFSGYNSKSKSSFKNDFSQAEIKALNISPYDQYFEIKWTMPSYFQNVKNTYTTKLKGFEDRWFYRGNSASLQYNKLPAGNYVLEIKGKDSRGVASASVLSIPITVRQIFYKKWWFITLSVIALIGSMYFVFRYRLEQVLAMERLRTKISSDLHDDVGSLLSGLAMQTELMEINASKADKSKLQKIASISRSAISQMRDLVWSIDSRRTTSYDLIERMHELAEEVLLPRDISFNIDSESLGQSNKKLTPQIKQNIFLIYKETITNLLKHSDATHFQVNISNQAKGCQFMLNDNGSVKENHTSTGFGLANMKMRVEAIGGTISFETNTGFTIILKLPFSL